MADLRVSWTHRIRESESNVVGNFLAPFNLLEHSVKWTPRVKTFENDLGRLAAWPQVAVLCLIKINK